MMEELIKELSELQEYKKKYEYAQQDKQEMSNLLFEYMMKEYKNTSYEDRCAQQISLQCRACRYAHDCLKNNFPEDIRMPVKSDKAWIPGVKSCENFMWS